jgi:hypothetical protein
LLPRTSRASREFERLPYNPGSQNEIPLSSAWEISGEHARAAVAATKPIDRNLDSIRAIANLHAAFATRAVIKAARERNGSFSNSHENDLPGSRAVSDSRSQAALEIRGELVTTEKI